mmetsp:Transcript_110489/g.345627  ORF Transcript_110489/g.345627 Transcript_110489/m.345627 type:complete len:204 (+) Transcript_110489:279-890(+)
MAGEPGSSSRARMKRSCTRCLGVRSFSVPFQPWSSRGERLTCASTRSGRSSAATSGRDWRWLERGPKRRNSETSSFAGKLLLSQLPRTSCQRWPPQPQQPPFSTSPPTTRTLAVALAVLSFASTGANRRRLPRLPMLRCREAWSLGTRTPGDQASASAHCSAAAAKPITASRNQHTAILFPVIGYAWPGAKCLRLGWAPMAAA